MCMGYLRGGPGSERDPSVWFGQDVQFVYLLSKSAGRPVNNSLRDRKT